MRDAGDDGFTLIELVIVLVIMPLVITAIFFAIFVTFQNEARVSTRITSSVDSQLTSEFYVRDVQSATLVTLTKTATSPTVCGSGSSLLVSLSWSSGTATGRTVVSYWKSPNGSGTKLVREACKTGSSRPSATTSVDFSSSSPTAQLACVSGKPKCATPGTATSATHTWIPAQSVSTITIAVVEPNGKYDYNVSAAPRLSNTKGGVLGITGGGSLATLPTLLLVGHGARVLSEDTSGTSVTIKGLTAISTTGYFHQTPGSKFTSTTGVETTRSPASKVCTTPHAANCATTSPPPATFKTVPAPLPDPLAGLPDPPEAPLGSTGGCPANPTAQPLQPGRYICAIKAKPGHTLTLSGGIYEFEKTVSVKNAALTAAAGVFMYFPCKNVDSWDTLSCSETLTATTSTVNVAPMTTGIYQGIWFWQNVGDSSAVTLHAKSTLAAKGIMYVPGAAVTLYGGPGSDAVGSIVAYVLDVHNGTFVLTGV